MQTLSDRERFIRDEFECFVCIAMDAHLRSRVRKAVEYRLISGNIQAGPLVVYFEKRDSVGTIEEMWYLETDHRQMLRLQEFLTRFTLEDARLISDMMRVG